MSSSEAWTFLFTDIQGSTRLWERFPDVMGKALVRHDAILREAIEAQGGRVFKTVGDAFCAVFDQALPAAAAALSAQRALLAEDWPEPVDLRVRMGLHSGPAEARDGDYFGPTLNRCARIESLAQGDQVLVSEDTAGQLRERMPEATRLVDLGRHRLRDLSRPVQVLQLTHAELPSDFPPLRSLDSRPNNLPIRSQPLIGRDSELAELRQALSDSRLLTLKGVGGLGKTRLALQLAAEVMEDFGDGLWFVDLAPLEEGALVPQALAGPLGEREEAGRSLTDGIIEHLRDQAVLIVLDNCEHVIEASAELAERLLRACPRLRILATSRESLDIEGERVWRLAPLGLPVLPEARSGGQSGRSEAEPDAAELGALVAAPAVQLFVDRARQADARFDLRPSNARAVAEICRRLDGIALAIELAAARVRMLPPEQIARRLDQSLRLLSKGNRGAGRHQQTLRAAIEWSFGLCTPDEQWLLTRLAVFHGGWTLEAAQAICVDEDHDDWAVLELLGLLESRSLVELDEQDEEDAPRHFLLETIRQFALERLATTGAEETALRDAHLAWCSKLAEQGDAGLKGAGQSAWLLRLDAEAENLRAALHWAAEGGAPQEGLRLGAHLWRYWHQRGHYHDGRSLLAAVLAAAPPESEPELLAAALHAAGTLALLNTDLAAAREQLEASLEIRRALDDLAGASATLNNLAMVAHESGDLATVRGILSENLVLKERTGDRWGLANTLHNLSQLDLSTGTFESAAAAGGRCLELAREIGDRRLEGHALHSLQVVATNTGDHAAALDYAQAALTVLESIDALAERAAVETDLGRLRLALGDYEAARELLQDCVERCRRAELLERSAWAQLELARVEHYAAEPTRARQLLEQLNGPSMEIDSLRLRSSCLHLEARVACRAGQLASARACILEALSIRLRFGRKPLILTALEGLALVLVAEGEDRLALTLVGSTSAARASIGMTPEPFEAHELESACATARARLGVDAARAAYARGCALDSDAAIHLVTEFGPEPE